MKHTCVVALLVVVLGLLSSGGVDGLTASPSLKASPDTLTATERSVTLTWSGVANPTSQDFLAVYSPANSSDTQQWLGWIPTSQDPNYVHGSGSITIPFLVNMRADYDFKLWVCTDTSDCTKYTSAVATSNPVGFDNPLAPSQGHLALTPNNNVLSLMWVSGDNSSTPTVQYGLSSSNLAYQSSGTTATYGMSLMCDSPANSSTVFKDPGFIHTAFLSNLSPATQYFYKFGSSGSGWSPVYSFISPQPQIADEEVYVVAYGDMGVAVPFNIINDQQPPALQTTALVQQLISTPGSTSPFAHLSNKYKNSNLPLPWTLLHIGDISYARGYGFLWDYFFDLIQPVSTQVPYMVCIGNHEYDYTGMPWRANDGYGNDSGGECGIPYNMRFTMTGESPATRNLWYSYNQGPIHFVYMSTEHNFLPGSPQYNWIIADLASVDRSSTPWIVFSGHRPAYTSSQRTSNESQMIQDIYEPIWLKFKVNMCLWGHVHVYERTCGVFNNSCMANDAAPVHVVIGMAGNDYQVPWASPDLSNGHGHSDLPPWSIFRTESYGYTRFFANATHLYFQFVGDQRGDVHDDFWLTPY